MKKFFIVLGAIFLTLILLGAVGIGISAFKGAALDKESRAYVDATVPAIISSWNAQELLSRASPEFKQTTGPDDVERFFQTLSPLGKMQQYQGSQGQSVISRILGKGTTISANYFIKAEFEGGSVKIYVKLIKHGNLWQIGGFHVEPIYSRRQPNQAMQPTAGRSIRLAMVLTLCSGAPRLLFCASLAHWQERNPLLQQAIDALNKGDDDEAIARCNKAISDQGRKGV